jgi:hypothetical protein
VRRDDVSNGFGGRIYLPRCRDHLRRRDPFSVRRGRRDLSGQNNLVRLSREIKHERDLTPRGQLAEFGRASPGLKEIVDKLEFAPPF